MSIFFEVFAKIYISVVTSTANVGKLFKFSYYKNMEICHFYTIPKTVSYNYFFFAILPHPETLAFNESLHQYFFTMGSEKPDTVQIIENSGMLIVQ